MPAVEPALDIGRSARHLNVAVRHGVQVIAEAVRSRRVVEEEAVHGATELGVRPVDSILSATPLWMRLRPRRVVGAQVPVGGLSLTGAADAPRVRGDVRVAAAGCRRAGRAVRVGGVRDADHEKPHRGRGGCPARATSGAGGSREACRRLLREEALLDGLGEALLEALLRLWGASLQVAEELLHLGRVGRRQLPVPLVLHHLLLATRSRAVHVVVVHLGASGNLGRVNDLQPLLLLGLPQELGALAG